MPGPPRLPLDPYPQFLLSSLDFDLDNLDQLHPYQLALVHFSPLATPAQRLRADVLWWQKRREAIQGSDEEVGLREVSAGLRQMKRAREWLEGKVPGSKQMRETAVQTDPPAPPPQDSSTRPTPATTVTPVPVDLPPSPSPQPTQPSNTAQTLGASTPLSLPQSTAPCPAELECHFFVLWCGDLSPRVSPLLFAHFLHRRTSKLLPFFFGIRRATTTSYHVAFRSYDDAYTAHMQLNGQAFPRMKCKIRTSIVGRSRGTFKWRHLDPETRRSWIESKSLPDKELVEQAKPAGKGITVSEAYHNELRRIEAAGQPNAERMSEADRKFAEEAREATLRWRREHWGEDFDGHSDSCATCPSEYDLDDPDRVHGVFKIVNDTKASYPDIDGPVWRPILKSPVLRSFVRAYGFLSLGLRADQMPWYRPPPPPTAPPTPPPAPLPQQSPVRPPPLLAPQTRARPPPSQPTVSQLPSRPTFTPTTSHDSYPCFAYDPGSTAPPADPVPRPGPSAYSTASAPPHNAVPPPQRAPYMPASQPYNFGGWAAQKRGAEQDQTTDPRKRPRFEISSSYGRTDADVLPRSG
ncbi:hypothetical protein JCM10295v2_000580 [Rhodotorula toruloides]